MALETFKKEFGDAIELIIHPTGDFQINDNDPISVELDRQIELLKAKANENSLSNGQIYYQAFLNVMPMMKTPFELVTYFSYLSAMMGEMRYRELQRQMINNLLGK